MLLQELSTAWHWNKAAVFGPQVRTKMVNLEMAQKILRKNSSDLHHLTTVRDVHGSLAFVLTTTLHSTVDFASSTKASDITATRQEAQYSGMTWLAERVFLSWQYLYPTDYIECVYDGRYNLTFYLCRFRQIRIGRST